MGSRRRGILGQGRKNGRSKWRRVNHQYEKVAQSCPTESSKNGCYDHELEFHNNTSTGNGSEFELRTGSKQTADRKSDADHHHLDDDEDEIDISSFRFGDERRRLLMHNGRISPPFNNIST